MYKLSEDTPLTPEHIVAYVNNNISEQARLNRLYDYYQGKHDILNRTMDDGKPNNKVVNSFANYIVSTINGYFMGIPPQYNSNDEKYLNKIKDIFNMNDEQAENAKLSKYTSIFGRTYEYVYIDQDSDVMFVQLDSRECIPIYKDDLSSELLYLIRYYDVEDIVTGNKTTKVEVYTKDEILYYDKNENGLTQTNSIPHIFNVVPIIEYRNNDEFLGDFENVISEIDAYDKMQSDTLNDFDLFSDAFLALTNYNGTESEDVEKMKQERIILLESDGNAEWLVKQTNDQHIENMKSRLEDDIHSFSFCPKMSNQDFGTTSGIAMRFKLLGLENKCSIKEREFKKGLQRRIELITYVLNIKGENFDYRNIDIKFNRNVPTSLVELADIISKINGVTSEETLLTLLPFVSDPKAEVAKKKSEISIQPYTIGNGIDTGSDQTA